MTLSAWTCVFCAYPGNDDLHLNCACCQQTRADRLLQPHEFERIHAHDRAMQEERERAAKMRYCAITDEMVPVDEGFVSANPILLKDLIKRVDRILKPKPKAVSKPVSAEKLI